jgi:hypothetical protein
MAGSWEHRNEPLVPQTERNLSAEGLQAYQKDSVPNASIYLYNSMLYIS